MFIKRAQFTNVKLPVDIVELIIKKYKQHTDKHDTRVASKARCLAVLLPVK